ncbi:MAG: sensory histidine kinase AtoS [Methanoregulaceae archaeon PtaU1.Bin059]|nr:MAG: sensory histidine kinase AtoS [Methanoregulaceae archaeon PtaB.Bin152]OPY38623.1 MAG: sensory histidine kinase AtoS [Methanoregulaceae archaeon PtaU1.Bin059]
MPIVDLIVWMLVISGISMAILGCYGRRFVGRVPAATPFVLIMFAASAWAILYTLDLLSSSLPLKIFYHNLRFLFLPYFAVLELWLVIAYVKKTKWLRLDWALAVLVIPVISSVLALTSPFHSLFRFNFYINTTGPVPVLQYTEGGFLLVYYTYIYILLAAAILILLNESRKSRTVWEIQTLLLLVALAFPTIINFLWQAGITPVPGVNMTPALLWIPAILYTIALFQYRFLDIIPVARSRIFETMNTPVIVLDMQGWIIDLNPAASQLLATTPDTTQGNSRSKPGLLHPALLELSSSETDARAELTWDSGGSIRHFQGSVEILRTPEGQPEGRLILLQDITDLKHAEQLLRESEEKFSKIFMSSPYAITISQLEDGLIVDVNRGFEQITEYRSSEVIGRRSLDLPLWVNAADREAIVDDLRRGEKVAGREYQFRTKSGRMRTGLFSAVIILVRGHPYILSTINDISDRKLAEEQREGLILELERKNRELDQFTHTISHDLRNPLFTIKGFLEILKEDIETGDRDQIQSDLGKITVAADTMEQLISSLLALSRSGRTIDTPVPVSFTEISREAAGLLDATIRQHGVTVVIPDHLPVVRGDRQRLLQVMINLIDNAVKFMGEQEAPRVEVGVRENQGTQVLYVRDNGRGIVQKDLEGIFGLFARLDKKVPGTGIGLATVKRIIEMHGGKVWAESEGPGKGTTICFTLPSAVGAGNGKP